MGDKIGLMVARCQPVHLGHTKIINHMIQDCETAIVCLGSAQKSREPHDPWTIEERMEMLRNVYADRIKIVPLNDLGAAHPDNWVGYIFDKLDKLGMKEPTDYYTGSEADAQWYKYHFWTELFGPDLSPSRSGVGLHDHPDLGKYLTGGQRRKLHIVERNHNPVPAATEIRTWLETRSDGWKNWVPSVNHDLVSSTYPEEFKIPMS